MFLCVLWHLKGAVYAVARRTPLVRPQQRDTIAGSVAQRAIRPLSQASSQARCSARLGIRAARRVRGWGGVEAGRDAVRWRTKVVAQYIRRCQACAPPR